MKDLHKILDVQPIRPEIWNQNNKILDNTSHTIKTLDPFTLDEKHLIFKKKIIAPLVRSQKHYQKKPLKSSEEDRWLVKSENDTILGPYTKSEMKDLISQHKLENTFIKRDNQKDFVKYDVIKENPDFLETNKQIEDINIELENIKIEDSQPFVNENNKFIIEERTGFYKCTEFLKLKKVDTKIDILIKKLYGKNKETAVNLIGFFTNLKMEDCQRFVDLIILESGNSVIVDNNGFIKAHKKSIKKNHINK